jgi:hypothetical protein
LHQAKRADLSRNYFAAMRLGDLIVSSFLHAFGPGYYRAFGAFRPSQFAELN